MWQNPLINLPSDNQTVWIRVGTNYGNPVQATFDQSNQSFTSIESGLIVPAYIVARWRA